LFYSLFFSSFFSSFVSSVSSVVVAVRAAEQLVHVNVQFLLILSVRFLSVQRRRCGPVVATGRVCCGSSSSSGRWYGLHAVVDVQARENK